MRSEKRVNKNLCECPVGQLRKLPRGEKIRQATDSFSENAVFAIRAKPTAEAPYGVVTVFLRWEQPQGICYEQYSKPVFVRKLSDFKRVDAQFHNAKDTMQEVMEA